MNKSLERYVSGINLFASFRNGKGELGKSVSLATREDLIYILDRIEGDLSPENLHCDGEISRSAARVKYRALISARSAAEKILAKLPPAPS